MQWLEDFGVTKQKKSLDIFFYYLKNGEVKKMKGIKKVLAPVLILALAMPMEIFAAGNVSVSVAGQEIAVTGSFEENAQKQYLAKAYKPGYADAADDTDEKYEGYLAALMQAESNEDGSFTLKLDFGEALLSGDYLLKISTANTREELETTFYYVSKTEQDDLLTKLNSDEETTSATDVQELIEKNARTMGIDLTAEFAQVTNQASVYTRMFELRTYEDMKAVVNTFRSLCLLSLIEQASDGAAVQSIMSANSDFFGLDDAVYNQLTDPLQALDKLRKYHASMEAFETAFEEAVAVTAFSQLSRTDMPSLIETYRSKLTLPSDYDSYLASNSAQALNLYKKMEAVTSFASFTDISNYIKENYKSSGGGGGGDGTAVKGSSSVGGTVVPTEDIAQPEQTPAQVLPFVDLTSTEWAHEAIAYLYEQGMISGVDGTHFEPDKEITREAFVTMIVRAFGVWGDSDAEFSDVEPGAWYAEYIDRAVSSQVIKGKGDGTFGVGETLTRQDMAVILQRVASYAGITVKELRAYEKFADAEQIGDYAKSAVKALYCAEILNGVEDNRFAPQDTATRAMAAKTIYELLMH